MGALDGIRVLDLGVLVQAPQAAAMLHDLGAEVIKIEFPGVGDSARWISAAPGSPHAPYFTACNRGKRSLTLDLHTDGGKDVLRRLIASTDVIVSNFKGGTMEAWGIGYDDLSAINPKLIYAAGTVFGALGDLASQEGADIAGQAAGGLIATTGVDGGPPTPVGVTIADHIASQNMVIGILTALIARGVTGRGQRIEVSLVGGQIWAQASEITAYLLSGEHPGRSNQGHGLINAMYGIFPTSDGWIAIVGVPPATKPAFFQTIGRPDLLDDPRFAGVLLAHADKPAVFEILQTVFVHDTTQNWVAKLRAAGQRVAPVNDYRGVVSERQNFDNGYLVRTEHPEHGPVAHIGSPIMMSDTPATPGTVAPELGQDTEIILMEAGYEWDEIEQLRAAGAI